MDERREDHADDDLAIGARLVVAAIVAAFCAIAGALRPSLGRDWPAPTTNRSHDCRAKTAAVRRWSSAQRRTPSTLLTDSGCAAAKTRSALIVVESSVADLHVGTYSRAPLVCTQAPPILPPLTPMHCAAYLLYKAFKSN